MPNVIKLNPNTSLWELLVQLSEYEAISISADPNPSNLEHVCLSNNWAYAVVR